MFSKLFKKYEDMEKTLPENDTRMPRRGSRGNGRKRNFKEGKKMDSNGHPQKQTPYKHFIWKDSNVDGWKKYSRKNLSEYSLAMKCAHESSTSAIYRARVQMAHLSLRINDLLEKEANLDQRINGILDKADKEQKAATNYQNQVQKQNAKYYDQLANLFSDVNIADEEIEKKLKDVRTSTSNAIQDLKKKHQLKEKADLSGANKVSEATGEQAPYDPDDPHQQVVVFQVYPVDEFGEPILSAENH